MSSKRSKNQVSEVFLGAFKALPPSETLDHLVRYLSTWSGSDKLFMVTLHVIQYSAKLLVSILQLRAGAQFRAGLRKDSASAAAESWKRLDSLIGNSRTLWRLWGLLPILQWLISMEKVHPPTRKLLMIERLQGWSMLAYYPLEHIYYLASHKVIPVNQRRIAKMAMWSCRFWMVYVVLQFFHLREDARLLQSRLRAIKGSGSELDLEEEAVVESRKRAIRNETLVNIGYLPLTIHWSLSKGLYRSEAWTGLFGLVAALASFRGGWAATATPPIRS